VLCHRPKIFAAACCDRMLRCVSCTHLGLPMVPEYTSSGKLHHSKHRSQAGHHAWVGQALQMESHWSDHCCLSIERNDRSIFAWISNLVVMSLLRDDDETRFAELDQILGLLRGIGRENRHCHTAIDITASSVSSISWRLRETIATRSPRLSPVSFSAYCRF